MISGKRIVRSGLQGDEKIVVNGLARVRPGMPVVPQDDNVADQPSAKSDGKLARR